MNWPARSAKANATLLMHLPAVDLDIWIASPTSCWKAPVATNRKNTSSCTIGERAKDRTVGCLTWFSTSWHRKKMVGRRNRYLSNNSSSVRRSKGFILSLNTLGRGKRLPRWTFSSSALFSKNQQVRPYCLYLFSVLYFKTAMRQS